MHDVFIPVQGMAPDEVMLTSWLRFPGDAVGAGDSIAVIETSKAEMELESDAAGTLGPHLYPAGATLAPGTTITHILAAGEQAPARHETARHETARHETARAPHVTSPRARRIAAEDTLASEADAREEGRRESTRAAIARAVSRSWSEVPHFSVSRELRVGDLVGTAAQWRAVLPRLTVTDLLLRVLALAMVDTVGGSGVDLGLAVATDAGVVIPVLRRVPELGMPELVNARVAAVARAREGRMRIDDATVPATTLSNLGALDVDHFTGVIPHGSTSLVTVGRAAQRPVVTDGALTVATTMWATVNLDHRFYDGIHGARLLDRFAVIASAPAIFLGGWALLAPPSRPTPADEEANR